MKTKFKPRARLLLKLGDQLIKNENIAVVELVKNAYDADATKCNIRLENIDQKEEATVTIEDNGVGMTPDIVEQIWLEPGADFKDLVLKGQLPLGLTYSAKRTPIGEKGIGRFGVHKLGDSIEMITKSASSEKEIIVRIDWEDFEKEKYLEDAVFDMEVRKPEFFTGERTGTFLRIKKIREDWDKLRFKELSKTVISLNSPFFAKSKNDFSTKLVLELEDKEKQGEWEKQLVSIDEIKEQALWKVECTISGNEITHFKYEFLPYPTMNKLSKKIVTDKDPLFTKFHNKLRDTKNRPLESTIGEIRIEIYLFYLGSKILRMAALGRDTMMDYLTENGGVRVYREGMRVYNYGEREDDWLNLDQKRISNVGGSIGNKLILGAVSLDKRTSLGLVEKTNREGFVENETYKTFKASILQVVSIVNSLRNIDKEKIKDIYEATTKNQPVLYDIDLLKETAEDKMDDLSSGLSEEKKGELETIKKDILEGLDVVKQQYIKTHDILIKAAGAGLSFAVVIHEIEKRIKELSKIFESEDFKMEYVESTRTLVKSLLKLLENYSTLVSSESKKKTGIKALIEDALFNCSFRFTAHEVTLVDKYKGKKDIKIECVPNIVIGAILNIFDNSLHWLNAYEVDKKKILIDIVDYPNEVGILIADNGKGFLIPPEDALKPFISMKRGGTGLGLHIVDEIMKIHKGKLLFRTYEQSERIPKEFSEGAIIELVFKKEK